MRNGMLGVTMADRILVSGSLAYDRIMDFPGVFEEHFLPEKLHGISVSFSVSPPVEQFGGTAGNIAYNLALLQEAPEIIASAGSDFFRYREHLVSLHVDPSSIQIAPELPTASAYIITDKRDNQIAAFSFAAGEKAYERGLDPLRYGVAMVGAGCPADMNRIPEFCRANNLAYLYDPGQQTTTLSKEELGAGVTGAAVVFGNDYEIKLIEEKTGVGEVGLLERAETLIITYGVDGSRVLTKEGEYRIAAVHAERAIDPTGAGDAYRAGYLKGYRAGLNPETCGKLGSTVAAYAVERYGTQNHHFTLAEFRARYQTAYNESCPV